MCNIDKKFKFIKKQVYKFAKEISQKWRDFMEVDVKNPGPSGGILPMRSRSGWNLYQDGILPGRCKRPGDIHADIFGNWGLSQGWMRQET